MTTIADLETLVRYELGDSGITQYPQAELVAYYNRSIKLLDQELANLKSDFTFNSATVTLLEDGNYVAAPTGIIDVRGDKKGRKILWYGTIAIYHKPVAELYYERQLSTAEERPHYFALAGVNFQFDRTADQDYALTVFYDKYTGTLAAGGTVPYGDFFNDQIQDAVKIIAKNRDELNTQIDAIISGIFHEAAMGHVITREYEAPRYRLDF